ncbi:MULTISPECIES: hypothetical protein [unclassified Amycolatopsis]|uniref:hypothetical protein n=1 Tax=unclassified Amycolatopsis TaxID=2618356 RepID=UPI001C6991E2|nr:hypothetical protein [Amycolatopsis sp. DSM 110486]QYN18811.1 hypothetical protein K1T34_39830 [Amycolatopsis sp. DSM 110486]
MVAAFGATTLIYSDDDMAVGCRACEGSGGLHGATESDWGVATDAATGKRVPMSYADSFSCSVRSLELEGDELDLVDVGREHYLDLDTPEDRFPVDEDFAYESWRDDRLSELYRTNPFIWRITPPSPGSDFWPRYLGGVL